jgi:hypothetical protein
MLTVVTVLFSGWLLAATLGTWAYFASENTNRSKLPLSPGSLK